MLQHFSQTLVTKCFTRANKKTGDSKKTTSVEIQIKRIVNNDMYNRTVTKIKNKRNKK